MLYSKKHNLLFVACPKTGSTSIEAVLLQIDAEGQRFRIDFNGKTYTSRDMASRSLGHATAADLKRIFGAEEFTRLRKFGFIRDPREKLISTYFFKRQGSIRDTLTKTRSSRRFEVTLRTVLGILLARVLPIKLWVRIWPMKKCSQYFLDSNGDLLVDYLGRTDRLGDDLKKILDQLGISGINELDIPHVNKSSHLNFGEYFSSPSVVKFIEKKYRDDFQLAHLVADDVFVRAIGLSDTDKVRHWSFTNIEP